MAITKILARKGRLDVGINYVLNGDKTQERVLTAHLNCDPGRECRQMLDTKRAYGKEDGVMYYHIILACTGAYIMGICLYADQQGRTRDGEEHGSATWASPRQVNTMFAQKQNKLLTKNVRLGLDTHKHRRSLNVLVIGGSGAGKSRTYAVLG